MHLAARCLPAWQGYFTAGSRLALVQVGMHPGTAAQVVAHTACSSHQGPSWHPKALRQADCVLHLVMRQWLKAQTWAFFRVPCQSVLAWHTSCASTPPELARSGQPQTCWPAEVLYGTCAGHCAWRLASVLAGSMYPCCVSPGLVGWGLLTSTRRPSVSQGRLFLPADCNTAWVAGTTAIPGL
jgi:hypothetical protein